MTNPYTPPTLTGYNANPPTDDGTEADQNKVAWDKHTEKLGDPLRDYANAINAEVESAFDAVVFPPGGVIAYAGETAPDGWVMCDGTSYNSSADPSFVDLFGAIGVRYGGTGAADFNVPNYQGYVLRMVSGTTDVDPDKDARLDRGDGTGGNVVGSKQDDAVIKHDHDYTQPITILDRGQNPGGAVTNTQTAETGDPNATNSAAQPVNTSDFETRMKNIYVNYIIKK